MAARQIPNLKTLRRGNLQSRRDGMSATSVGVASSKDEIVQKTDNDAVMSRLSAIEAGYLDDPFAMLLNPEQVSRRLPLMNRGTFARTTGIDKLVKTFLSSCEGRKQIISLGAGSDTRYFRLKREDPQLDLVYHEIDFDVNTRRKIQRLKSTDIADKIRNACSIDFAGIAFTESELHMDDYHIHGRDLRTLTTGVNLPGLTTDIPTLLISECCLVYLSPSEAEAALAYFTTKLATAPLAITIYEPVRPNDSFGRTMIRNLVSRGIHLQTLEKYAELDDQRQRLLDHHFKAHAADIDFIWRLWVSQAERERVDGLEWMDEVEEFVLLARHYCIAWGWRNWDDDASWRALPAP